MATVIGTSGAWRQVTEKLEHLGIRASSPRELRAELARQRASYDDQVRTLAAEVDQEIADLEQQLLRLRAESESRIVARCAAAEAEISQLERHIVTLQSGSGIFRSLLGKVRMSVASAKKERLEYELNRFCAAVSKEIDRAQSRLEQARQGREASVERRRQDLDHRIAELRAVLLSGELAGASAELEVIDALSRLPEGCVLLNDVRLVAERFIRFAGQPLQSAQLDHVVLTEQGVFVIEVKNWSAEFVDGQQYFDPYKQVSRSRFLCQTLLRDHGLACKVRGVIAATGKIPPKQPDQYVRLLAPQQLVKYIRWFKEPPLTGGEVSAIRAFLEDRVGR